MIKYLSDPRDRMLSAVQLESSGISGILATVSPAKMILIYGVAHHPPGLGVPNTPTNPTAETAAVNQSPEVDDPASRVNAVKPDTDLSVFTAFLFQNIQS
ncbi:MAG: hypothetical protein E5Y89_11810 [Mesorhizobium sp.]|nr:MAG: hypothetical protein E5Y89_11810 [Mesorhizobium sp.]